MELSASEFSKLSINQTGKPNKNLPGGFDQQDDFALNKQNRMANNEIMKYRTDPVHAKNLLEKLGVGDFLNNMDSMSDCSEEDDEEAKSGNDPYNLAKSKSIPTSDEAKSVQMATSQKAKSKRAMFNRSNAGEVGVAGQNEDDAAKKIAEFPEDSDDSFYDDDDN